MTSTETTALVNLTRWAEGSRGRQAAVRIVTTFHYGQFADALWAWVKDAREDAHLVRDHAGYASSGERVMLTFAQAFVTETPIDLSDIARVDHATARIIVDALAHAAGLS